jgi:hypothetical protein
MATESSTDPVNGNYGAQQSYQPTESFNAVAPAANGANGGHVGPAANGHENSGAAESKSGVPKDEVGWYFVEQYYTTLSRNPEKLHVCRKISAPHWTAKQLLWDANRKTVVL